MPRPATRQTSGTVPDGMPVRAVFDALHRVWGGQAWWPGETPLEVCVGAILTQNTAWTNVERALERLKAASVLELPALHEVPLPQLAEWIRPSGYYNLKARRLRAFTTLVMEEYGGALAELLAEPRDTLREKLLAVYGIGPETADSMALYAGGHAVFVVDAYTRRVLERHGWISPSASYDDVARVFTRALPAEEGLFNEYHALLVQLGKHRCRPTPRCDGCPLQAFLPESIPPGG